MTKTEFQQLAEQRIILLDGAMGTNLFLRGMPRGVCTEQWILEKPETAMRLQREYAEAGSDILYAPTFGANRGRLKDYGLEEKVRGMNRDLVSVTRKAAEGTAALIAGDLSPSGLMMESAGGDALREEVSAVYREQAEALEEAGVDLFVIETMMSEEEIVTGAEAILSVTEKPVIATMTVDENGRALFGGTLFEAAKALENAGVSAVGVNCCSGPDKLLPLIKKLGESVNIPVIAKPNAGMPVIDRHGMAHYDMDAETFVTHMKTLHEAGAGILGGCCGTTPEYIRALKETFR